MRHRCRRQTHGTDALAPAWRALMFVHARILSRLEQLGGLGSFYGELLWRHDVPVGQERIDKGRTHHLEGRRDMGSGWW